MEEANPLDTNSALINRRLGATSKKRRTEEDGFDFPRAHCGTVPTNMTVRDEERRRRRSNSSDGAGGGGGGDRRRRKTVAEEVENPSSSSGSSPTASSPSLPSPSLSLPTSPSRTTASSSQARLHSATESLSDKLPGRRMEDDSASSDTPPSAYGANPSLPPPSSVKQSRCIQTSPALPLPPQKPEKGRRVAKGSGGSRFFGWDKILLLTVCLVWKLTKSQQKS